MQWPWSPIGILAMATKSQTAVARVIERRNRKFCPVRNTVQHVEDYDRNLRSPEPLSRLPPSGRVEYQGAVELEGGSRSEILSVSQDWMII
jgi:hypothetical protein